MKVLKKQTNSVNCIICGIENKLGLNASFYEMENETVVATFTFKSEHQSYPGRTHGGMISALLDELIGRAIWIKEPQTWGVTIELTIRYRKPVPYGVPLKAIGEITNDTRRTFEGVGKIIDENGVILAEGKATYFKMPLDKISSEDAHDEVNILVPDNVTDITIK